MNLYKYNGSDESDSRNVYIISIDEKSGRNIFAAEVPLALTFGYISDLRTLTSGKTSIRMKLSHYALVPDFIANTLMSSTHKDCRFFIQSLCVL